MVARAYKKRTRREVGVLDGISREVASAMRDVRNAMRGPMRRLELQAGDVEKTVRQLAARTLREVAKRIRRLERTITPPAPKRQVPKKQAAVRARDRPRPLAA